MKRSDKVLMFRNNFFCTLGASLALVLGFGCSGGGSGTSSGSSQTLPSNGSIWEQGTGKLTGALDTNFNGSGYVVGSYPSNKLTATRDSQGRTIKVAHDASIFLTRYLKGTLTEDASFSGFVAYQPFTVLQQLYVSLDSSDNIYVAATGYTTNSSYPWTVVRKYKVSDGSLDTSYGTSGTAIVKFNTYTGYNNDQYFGMSCWGDGSCYVYGSSAGKLQMERLSPSGVLDTSFANLYGFNFLIEGYSRSHEFFTSMSLAPDGSLNLAGVYHLDQFSIDSQFPYTSDLSVLWQMNRTNGAQNTSFGNSGGTATKMFSSSSDNIIQLITSSSGIYSLAMDSAATRGFYWRYKNLLRVQKFTSNGHVDLSFNPISLNYSQNPPGGGGTTGGMAIDFHNLVIYTAATTAPTLAGPTSLIITANDASTGLAVNTFGTSGTFTVDLTADGYEVASVQQILFDGNGRLLIFGYVYPAGNANGQQDPIVMVIK